MNQALLRIREIPAFGTAVALCQGMMPTLIEDIECKPRPYRTREEAAQLLEELRAAYLELASPERGQIRNHISKLARVQSTIESF